MRYILKISEKKFMVFGVLACAEVFKKIYGGEIKYEMV